MLPIKNLIYDFLLDYETHLFSIGNGRNTINTKFKFFKAALKDACKLGYLDKNPFDHYTIKDVEHAQKEVLTFKEVKQLHTLHGARFTTTSESGPGMAVSRK